MAEEATSAPAAAIETPAAPEAPAAPLLNGQAPAAEPVVESANPNTETEKAPEVVVPETYEFKVPDGMTLDQSLLDKFVPFAKDRKMSQEDAQALLDLHVEQRQADAKAHLDAWAKQQQDWAVEFKNDKEFGGPHFDASSRSMNAALSKFATPEEIKAITDIGLGNFTPWAKIMTRVGKLMGEDKFVQGGAANDNPGLAKTMFPDMK